MSNEHFVLNLMNGVNLAAEFRNKFNTLQRTSDKKQKGRILKNLVVHTQMMSAVAKSINQEARMSGQKLAAVRHGKKVTEIDYDTTLKQIIDLDIDNMDEITIDTLGRIFTQFSNEQLFKVADQMTLPFWQEL